MYYKQLLLTISVILTVIIFFKSDLYGEWYKVRVSNFFDTFSDEADNLDYEWRKKYRWENSYDMAKFIKRTIGNDSNELIIIPDIIYVRNVEPRLIMPEPITLYYLTGIRSVYPASKYADSAKFGLYIEAGNIKLAKIVDERVRGLLKAHYAEKTTVN